jgi:hypothetical protein
MAGEDFPHPAFKTMCHPIHFKEHRVPFGLQLELIQEIGPSGSGPAVALWEHDHCDGHAFEIMFCEGKDGSIEFWNVLYTDDMDGPVPELVGRSEQGLYYWLFFYLIPAQFFRSNTKEQAYHDLRAAAQAAGFQYFEDVLKFEEEVGAAENSYLLIRQQSVQIKS